MHTPNTHQTEEKRFRDLSRRSSGGFPGEEGDLEQEDEEDEYANDSWDGNLLSAAPIIQRKGAAAADGKSGAGISEGGSEKGGGEGADETGCSAAANSASESAPAAAAKAEAVPTANGCTNGLPTNDHGEVGGSSSPASLASSDDVTAAEVTPATIQPETQPETGSPVDEPNEPTAGEQQAEGGQSLGSEQQQDPAAAPAPAAAAVPDAPPSALGSLRRRSLLPPAPPASSGDTLVDSVFGGVLISRVVCGTCQHASVSYEPFLDLSVPIPTVAPIARRVSGALGLRPSTMLPLTGCCCCCCAKQPVATQNPLLLKPCFCSNAAAA